MVIYQKLLPRTKKRGVFYLSLKISSLNRLASYDEYAPGTGVLCPISHLVSNVMRWNSDNQFLQNLAFSNSCQFKGLILAASSTDPWTVWERHSHNPERLMILVWLNQGASKGNIWIDLTGNMRPWDPKASADETGYAALTGVLQHTL